MKIAGSGSRSISQRHESADPDPVPDPYQNVTDPQIWTKKEHKRDTTGNVFYFFPFYGEKQDKAFNQSVPCRITRKEFKIVFILVQNILATIQPFSPMSVFRLKCSQKRR
jgi:hypothetical protein